MNKKIKQKTILIITDGIGYKADNQYNAFFHAQKTAYKWLFDNIPYGMVATHGESVGLPHGQMGNSEVGHMTLGSGRILYHDLVRINKSISNKELEKHSIIQDFAQKCNIIHLIGLLSDGGVHSHIEHIWELIRIFSVLNVPVYIHIITDGRDVLPKSAVHFVQKTQDMLYALDNGSMIASMSGRFYAMDRDSRWERVLKAYQSIALAHNKQHISPIEYINQQYENDISDEFIQPAAFGIYEGFKEGDGIIFANFRSDRAREIVSLLGDSSFNLCERGAFIPIPLATMTCYDEKFSYPVLFEKQNIHNTIAEICSQHSLRQLHTAETEKYAHVTFFFNGGIEKEYPQETRILIPSPDVKTYNLKPEMSAKEVGNVVLNGMEEGIEFIVVNFANGDMVGHTGDFHAAIKAVEAVDREIGRIFKRAQEMDYAVVLTSDHGNCEEMADSMGNPLTNHTVGDVWCFVMAHGVKHVGNGNLAQVAATVLEVMGIPVPQEMEKSLIA